MGIYLNSLYSLLLISILLFYGGRFLSSYLGSHENIFELDFFVFYNSSDISVLKLGTYLLFGMIFLDLGFKSVYLQGFKFSNIEINHDWYKKFCIMALILSPLFLIELFISAKDAFTGGYLSSKEWQTQSYKFPLSSLAQTIFGIGLGYSVIKGYLKKFYLPIFLLNAFISALIGARGPFMIAMLFLLWVYGDYGQKKVNVLKLVIIGLTSIISISYFIQIYSYRSNGLEFEVDILKFLSTFFYEQGVSMMVFDVSMKVSDYPTLAYFQSFVPGSSAIASLFVDVEYYMTGFQHYMAKTLDPYLFSLGYGLDWTLFSDFYVFGGETLLGFCCVAFLFGLLFALLHNSCDKQFWLVLTCAIFSRLIFLPRSSFSILFPFMVYYFIFLYVFPRIKIKR